MQDSYLLTSGFDSDDGWIWRGKASWQPAYDENLQEFYKHWRGRHIPEPTMFPHELALGSDMYERPLLSFRPNSTRNGKIVVTQSYFDTANRLFKIREEDLGQKKGAVVTGQPGTGKTTFLKYLLVRLLAANQVVLLYTGPGALLLFYQGQVYLGEDKLLRHLPRLKNKAYFPIWALIDMDGELRSPPVLGADVWPIHASPPDPVRYKIWSRQNRAAMVGLPMWNDDELLFGLQFQPLYENLKKDLRKRLTEAALSRPEVPVPMDVHSDYDGEIQAEVMLVEDALETQVQNAIIALITEAVANYGSAPRDVYNAIFEPAETAYTHRLARRYLTYESLQDLVRVASGEGDLSPRHSDNIIAITPIPFGVSFSCDSWQVNFKSARISREVALQLRAQEDLRLRELYKFPRTIPDGSTLGGGVSESIVRCLLSGSSENVHADRRPTI